jgi:hypothetical protein
LTDYAQRMGGATTDAADYVSVDNATIAGNGTAADPLRMIQLQPLNVPAQLAFPADASKVSVAADGVTFTAATALYLGLPMRVGDTLASFVVNLFGNAAADIIVLIEQRHADGTATMLVNATIANTPATWTAYLLELGAQRAIPAGDVVVLTFTANAAGIVVGVTAVNP